MNTNHRTTLLNVLFLTLVFACNIEPLSACIYGPPYRTVCETYTQADSVIIGKIRSVEGDSLNQRVVIEVARTFKGQSRRQIVLCQPLSGCGSDFSGSVDETLLLYLVRDKQTKNYSALAEGMGGRLERQAENLSWLKNLPGSLKRTRVSGQIRLYQEEPFEFIKSVAGVKIRVFDANHSFEVATDKNGVYEIWDIPAGKYQIEPVIPPNLKLDLHLEKGLVDFDSLKKNNPDTDAVLIEIQPKGCGGIDFVVNEQTERADRRQMFQLYSFLWTRQGSLERSHREIVPVREVFETL